MKKIVVADDEQSMRLLITETLAIEDYDIKEAKTGSEALQLIEDEQPDIAILDLMMPELDGYQVIEQLKEKNILEKIEIVILTAKGQQSVEKEALSKGANHFLSKPFSPVELLKKINQIAAE
ncbi:MAG: response regulator transcription factor [Bacillota bacterium]